MFPLLRPHLRVRNVCELSLERLRGLGLEALLLDVDCTLARYHQCAVTSEVARWLAELRAAGIGLCLLSNGLGGRIRRLAEHLDLPCVAPALKPLPFGCWKALRKMNFPRTKTAMVGDQLFADILAGRLAGLMTVLVEPIHPEEEPLWTRIKRRPERWMMEQGSGAGDQGPENQALVSPLTPDPRPPTPDP